MTERERELETTVADLEKRVGELECQSLMCLAALRAMVEVEAKKKDPSRATYIAASA